jgi:hypothetical protein
MFIKGKGDDFMSSWYHFVKKGKDSKFYVNPKPKFTSDIVLNQSKMKTLFDEVIVPAKEHFELGPNVMYSSGSMCNYYY